MNDTDILNWLQNHAEGMSREQVKGIDYFDGSI